MSSVGVNATNKKSIKYASVISHAFFRTPTFPVAWKELMLLPTASHGKPRQLVFDAAQCLDWSGLD